MRRGILFPLLCIVLCHAFPAFAIINGITTADSSYSGVGAVIIGDIMIGTGVLIDPSWVLITAHENLDEWTLQSFVTGNNVSSPTGTYAIDAIIIHTGYDEGTGANDIGLLHLSTPVTTGDPLPLLTAPDGLAIGNSLLIVGFGEASSGGPVGIKRQGSVEIDTWDLSSFYSEFTQTNCGAGLGDSAAPAFTTGSPQKVAGIAYSVAGAYTAYVRVSNYLPWITATMASDFNRLPSAPMPKSPSNASTVSRPVTCTWDPATDLDGDELSYRVSASETTDFTNPIEIVVPSEPAGADASLALVAAAISLLLLRIRTKGKTPDSLIRIMGLILVCGLLMGSCVQPPSNTPAVGTLQCTFSTLKPSTEYYWKVTALDGRGGETHSVVWRYITE